MAEKKEGPYFTNDCVPPPRDVLSVNFDNDPAARRKAVVEKYSQLVATINPTSKSSENIYLVPESKQSILSPGCKTFNLKASDLFDNKFLAETKTNYQNSGEMHYRVIERLNSAAHLKGVLEKFLNESGHYRTYLEEYNNSDNSALKDEDLLKEYDAAVAEINSLLEAVARMQVEEVADTDPVGSKNNASSPRESKKKSGWGSRLRRIFSSARQETVTPTNEGSVANDKKTNLDELKKTAFEKLKMIDEKFLLVVHVFAYAGEELGKFFSNTGTATDKAKELSLIFAANAGNVADMLRADTRKIAQLIATEVEVQKARQNQVDELKASYRLESTSNKGIVYKN